MPRFVILRHDAPRGVHWDLMLEHGAALLSWSLPYPPDEHLEQAAEALPDHRLLYLDYEGPLSGERGVVSRWDQGVYEFLEQTPVRSTALLHGIRLRGQATLEHLGSTPSDWHYCFTPTPCARGQTRNTE